MAIIALTISGLYFLFLIAVVILVLLSIAFTR